MKYSTIQHLFDRTLYELFQRVPSNAFYLVKCWVNMDVHFSANPNGTKFFDSRVFYSPYKMDVDTLGIGCSFGNRVNCVYAVSNFFNFGPVVTLILDLPI